MFRTTSKNSKSAHEEVGKMHEGPHEMISGFKEQLCAALNRLFGNDQDVGCNTGVRRLRRKRDPCADGTVEALVVSGVRMRNIECVGEQLVGSGDLDVRCATDLKRRSGAQVGRISPTWFHVEANLRIFR